MFISLDRLIKINLYLLVFLVPLFFLPLTVWPVALNKQMLLTFLAFLCLILWLIKIIVSGRFSMSASKISILVFLMLLVLGFCTLFSGARLQSFWGMSQETDTYFNFLLFGLVFFLFANTRIGTDKKRIDTDKYPRKSVFTSALIRVFLASAALLALLFLVQVFTKKPIFPWDFAQFLTFNPIGTAQALGLFLGTAFVILASLITAEKNADQNAEQTLKRKSALNLRLNLRKISGIVLGILLFASIFIINYWLIWLGIALSLVIIMAEMSKSIGKSFEQKELKRFFLPMILLALSLMFIFIRIPTENIIDILPEITPTYKATFDIAGQTFKESAKNIVLGSGPATWGYQFSLYRPIGLNLTDFWQIRFNQSIAALPTFLATFGVLGILPILLLVGIFFFQGLKMVYSGTTSVKNQRESASKSASISGQQLAVFVAGVYLFLCWFFYPLNFTLAFSAFLFLGLWTSFSVVQRKVQRGSAVKEFSFTQSPQKAFFTMMLCVILIVASAVGLYKISQKYRAALVYAQGLALISKAEPELDKAIAQLNQAAVLDKKDVYFRNLSELFLIKMNEVANNQELEQEQKQELFQQIVSNAEMSATVAVQINPKNSQNWLQLGAVYENLAVFGVEGAQQLAISNYGKTQELDPQNPQIPLNVGRVYKTEVERIKIQIAILEKSDEPDEQELAQNKEVYSQNFDLSMQYFEKSIELKPNFSAAYFLTAQNYETNDEPEKALENYRIVLQLEPESTEVKARIEELQAAD